MVVMMNFVCLNAILIYIFCLPRCARSLSLSFFVALYKRNFQNATLRTGIYILIILPERSHQHCHLYQMTISIEIMQLRFLWKRATFFTIHSFSLKLVGWLLHRKNERKTEKKLYIFNNLDVWHTATRNFFFSFLSSYSTHSVLRPNKLFRFVHITSLCVFFLL